jgi:histidinol-phosphate/aromatic aminotransferase/cobyric acid decarboxylase-like protein
VEAAVKQHRPKIVFLTSPNNPDGSTISEVPVALRMLGILIAAS